MIDRRSLPVWMLADTLLITSLFCGFTIIAICSPFSANSDHLRQIRTLESQLQTANNARNNVQAENTVLMHERDRLKGSLATERKNVEKLHKDASEAVIQLQAIQKQIANEPVLRQELLNLRGSMERALFVIDISGSMGKLPDNKLRRTNWSSDQVAWNFAQNQTTAWLTHLPVKSFRLLLFNHDTKQFPVTSGAWVSGEKWKSSAKNFLSQQKPIGHTNTEKALREALASKPSCIILFTDGAPTDSKGSLDPNQNSRVLKMLRDSDQAIPINVVALGNYFNEDLANFLQEIATITGGSFVGL